MISATFASAIDPPWLHLHPVVLGEESRRGGEPDAYVLVEGDGLRMRCDIHDELFPLYSDAQVWGGLLIVGYAARLYCVDLATRSVKTYSLEWYFMGIHREADLCLVLSAQDVLRLNPDGSVRWTARYVGLDGVAIDRIEGDIISGNGEWDPPGGERPFEVSLSTGEILKAG